MDEFIPFHRPTIYPAHIEAVAKVLKSGWISTGKVCGEFEHGFLNYVGGKHAVAVNSCTAAIHLTLSSVLKPGDEVITSPITFVSAVSAIEHLGATPVFADVRDSDLTIDPDSVEKLITHRTRVIMATHFAGAPCQMSRLQEIANSRGILLIADAAHAIEARYGDLRSGEMAGTTCYSFYATKNITCGEGGMLVTNSDEMAEYAQRMRLNGVDKDAWKRYMLKGYKHWDIEAPGWKMNLSDLQASLGLAQLSSIEDWLGTRRMISNYYEMELGRDRRIKLLKVPDGCSPALHLFVIRVKHRDAVMDGIQKLGVGVGIHFRAVHRLKYYQRKYALPVGALPVAERASEEVLSLPLYPSLGMAGANRVASAVIKTIDSLP